MRREQGERSEWERTRQLGFWTATSNGAKIKSPRDLGTFEWESTKVDDLAEKIRKYRENKKRLQKKKHG